MNHVSRVALFAIVVAISFNSCKTTTTASTASATSTTQEPEGKHMDDGDMYMISPTLRSDLESFFQSFSEISLDDEEKRLEQIEYGLKYFQNDQTPVLIIVNQMTDDKKIYDEPTTIVNYLDYLKHTKQNPHTINNFELDDEGKIKMLELITKTL